MKQIRNISFVSIIIIVVALTGIFWPLMRRGFYVSDDGEWMIIRLTAFYQSLADGQFPVRFLGRLNNSYGYPVANFLYPGFLYIGSILHGIGFSFVTSVKLIMIGAVGGASVFLYASIRRMYSSGAALLGTLAFIGSPYLLYDLYLRGSVGEILAFLPAGAGMYAIITGNPLLFALAVGILVLAHNTFAMFFLVVYGIYIAVYKEYRLIRQLLLGLGMSAFFWIPALLEKQLVRFGRVSVSDPTAYLLGGDTFWLIGLAGMVSLCVLVFVRFKKTDCAARTALLLYGMVVFFVLPVSAFVWKYRPFAVLVQFPYRLLGIGTLVVPWIVACAYERIGKQKTAFVLLLVGILIVPAWYMIKNISFVIRDEGYYTTNESTTTVADEYLPKWVRALPDKRMWERLTIIKGRGSIVYEYLNTQRITAHVDMLDAGVIRIHTIYYPGWGVTVDGIAVPIAYDNVYGFMEIAVKSGKHTIAAEFRETVPRFLSDVLSVASVAAWFLFVLKWFVRR